MNRTLALLAALLLAGCFAPPFPDAPVGGSGHGGRGVGAAALDDHHGGASAAALGIALSGACFVVGVPGDTEGSWIHGTLFAPVELPEPRTIVVLIPGGATFAHVFDGEHFRYGQADGTTLPRALARAGYAALVIDRLGLGLSPYAGHGGRLTAEAQDEHMADIVVALRGGAYEAGPADALCPADEGRDGQVPRFARVVLAGQSLGGSLVMRNAVGALARADGHVVMGMTNQPLGAKDPNDPVAPQRALLRCIDGQLGEMATRGYYEVLCPGPDGMTYGCFDVWMWPPGADPAVLRAFCANDQIHAEPIGSVTMFNQAAAEAISARIPSARAPIHFVFARLHHERRRRVRRPCEDARGDRGMASLLPVRGDGDDHPAGGPRVPVPCRPRARER